MAKECPRTKALSDFLVASPHDSARKWAEYVALAPDLAGFVDAKGGHGMESPSSPLCVLNSANPTNKFGLKRDSTRNDLSTGA